MNNARITLEGVHMPKTIEQKNLPKTREELELAISNLVKSLSFKNLRRIFILAKGFYENDND